MRMAKLYTQPAKYDRDSRVGVNALGQVIDNNVRYDLNIEERGHTTYVRYIGIGCTFIIVIDRVDGGMGEYGGGFWVV